MAGDKYVTKYTNCIYADQEVIDAVLNGDRPDTTDPEEIVLPTAFVKVLDDQFEAEDNLEDRGYEPVDVRTCNGLLKSKLTTVVGIQS